MHPYTGIVLTDIRPDNLSMRVDRPNKLTCHSTGKNDSPRSPHNGPVTWNPAPTWPVLTLRLLIRPRSRHLRQCHDRREHSDTASKAIRYPSLVPSSAPAVPLCPPFMT